MNTQRILLLSYIALGVVVALVLEHLVGAIAGGVSFLSFLNRTNATLDVERFGATVLGYVLAIALVLYCWFNARVRGLATQVVEELQRVSWPTGPETRANTIAVILATFIVAIILGVFDYGWGLVTDKIYSPQ